MLGSSVGLEICQRTRSYHGRRTPSGTSTKHFASTYPLLCSDVVTRERYVFCVRQGQVSAG